MTNQWHEKTIITLVYHLKLKAIVITNYIRVSLLESSLPKSTVHRSHRSNSMETYHFSLHETANSTSEVSMLWNQKF